MQDIIGVVMVVAGVVLGLYVGVWLCFIGGIVDVINAIKAEDIIALDIAIGIGKYVFAGAIGMLSAMVLIVPGMACWDK